LKEELSLDGVEGEGVKIKLNTIIEDNDNIDNEVLCFSAYIRDIRNLLELPELSVRGMSINNKRIIYKSTINCVGHGLAVDFKSITQPIEIDIVGDSTKIINVLNTKKYLPLLWHDVEQGYLDINFIQSDNIVLEKYNGSIKTNFVQEYEN